MNYQQQQQLKKVLWIPGAKKSYLYSYILIFSKTAAHFSFFTRCESNVDNSRATLEPSFEISDGHPQVTFSYLCWIMECIQNLCQLHQKAAGIGFVSTSYHTCEQWILNSPAHVEYNLIPQLFGASDIHFEHIPTFSIGKWMSTEGVHLWFQNFVPKVPP